jgi:hypothetical protein
LSALCVASAAWVPAVPEIIGVVDFVYGLGVVASIVGAGAALSLTNVSMVVVFAPKLSVPVTVSVGPLAVPLVQLNGADTKGPPAGVETVPGANEKPVVVPPSAAKLLETGVPAVAMLFVSVKLPAVDPR